MFFIQVLSFFLNLICSSIIEGQCTVFDSILRPLFVSESSLLDTSPTGKIQNFYPQLENPRLFKTVLHVDVFCHIYDVWNDKFFLALELFIVQKCYDC